MKNHDWKISLLLLLLSAIGLIINYSTTIGDFSNPNYDYLYKHLLILLVAIVIYFAVGNFDFSWLRHDSIILVCYVLTLLSLIGLQIAAPEIAGTRRWYTITGFSIQPSEYAKIVIIFITAAICSRQKEAYLETSTHSVRISSKVNPGIQQRLVHLLNNQTFKSIILSTISLIPILILTLIQPALGNTIITFTIWIVLMLLIFSENKHILSAMITIMITSFILIKNIQIQALNGELVYSLDYTQALKVLIPILLVLFISLVIRFKINLYLLILSALLPTLLLLGMYFSWQNLLTDYQKLRVVTYFEGAELNADSSGYQIIQSQIAIGSGRLKGTGFLQGPQSSQGYLTQAHTDFAFASFSEQFGFIGSLTIISLYTMLILRIIKAANESKNKFDSYVSFGIGGMFTIHFFINIIMNMGLMPVTGIPLPIISYGGSSTISAFLALGIIQSINSQKKIIDMSDRLMVRSIESLKS